MPRVAQTGLFAVLVRCLDIQLAEHLLKGLFDLMFKEVCLICRPCAALVEVERVGNQKRGIRRNRRARAVRGDERIRLVEAERTAGLKYKCPQQRGNDGIVRHNVCNLMCEEWHAVLHRFLKHFL